MATALPANASSNLSTLVGSFQGLNYDERQHLIQELKYRLNFDYESLSKFVIETTEPATQGQTIVIPKIHKTWYDHLKLPDRFVAIFAPMGFSKSTELKKFCTEEIFNQIENFILYVSSSFSKSTDHLKAITSILQNPTLQKVFKYEVRTCNTYEIEILFESGHECKIQAVGQGADILGINFKGRRPSLILIDDLEEKDQARSQIRTDNLSDWLMTTLVTRLPSLATGRIRLIGTILTKNSLHYRILHNLTDANGQTPFRKWKVFKYGALDENDQSIWEDRHPTEILKEERQNSPRDFAANFMNEPMDEAYGLIKASNLQYYHIAGFDYSQIIESYAHFDLASTMKEQSDYFAGTVVGKAKDGKLYILDLIYTKIDAEQQAKIIIQTWQKWNTLGKLKKITMDAIAYQNTLKTWTDKEARSMGVYLNLQGIKYSKDKMTHFLPHEPLFLSNSVYLPIDHSLIQSLEQEILTFPHGVHDDLVDCLSNVFDNYNKPIQKKAFIPDSGKVKVINL
jgi:predicted phage terminase large subunit-like protein